MKILNLTRLQATKDQLAAGVVEVPFADIKGHIVWLNTFYEVPSDEELMLRADLIYEIATNVREYYLEQTGEMITGVMLGGEHFLVRLLEKVFIGNGVKVFYPFSCPRNLAESVSGNLARNTLEIRQFYGFVVNTNEKVEHQFDKMVFEKQLRDLYANQDSINKPEIH